MGKIIHCNCVGIGIDNDKYKFRLWLINNYTTS